jgi:hypothetical protein
MYLIVQSEMLVTVADKAASGLNVTKVLFEKQELERKLLTMEAQKDSNVELVASLQRDMDELTSFMTQYKISAEDTILTLEAKIAELSGSSVNVDE